MTEQIIVSFGPWLDAPDADGDWWLLEENEYGYNGPTSVFGFGKAEWFTRPGNEEEFRVDSVRGKWLNLQPLWTVARQVIDVDQTSVLK